MYTPNDTIVALSSAAGAGGRGIIRLSGCRALSMVSELFTDRNVKEETIPTGTRRRGCWRLAEDISCEAELYLFRKPHSYTTEDMAELHLPGSVALLQMIIEELLGRGSRMAEPGEFTARAFFNGRIDLTEAEAVAAVISARSDGELRAAERLLNGQLHQTCRHLTGEIAEILALIEAEIDFSEEDIEFAPPEKVRREVNDVRDRLKQLLFHSINWEELSHLPQVAVAGPANAGKSSLVNRLLDMDRSIVSGIAGTTRDLLSAPLALTQGECMLLDTAGLGEVSDALAEPSQNLTCQAVIGCNVLLWVVDATQIVPDDVITPSGELNAPDNVIVVVNKTDLISNQQQQQISRTQPEVIPVSALYGDNIDMLKQAIEQALHIESAVDTSGSAIALTARQRHALEEAEQCLQKALSILSDPEAILSELIALELRMALDHLGSISGEVVTEDVLGRIFHRFCVGK